MTYIIYGINDYLIKKEIEDISKKNNIDKDSITTYSNEQLMVDIINDASRISLFSDKKLIIVDYDIFDSTNSRVLESYLKNENPNTILVFVIRSEKLDERKKVIKLIANKIDCNKVNISSFAKKLFEDYTISPTTLNKLITRVGDDLFNLSNEIEKLKTYKINDKVINEEDLSITIKNIDDDIFGFIDSVINKNSEKVIEVYNELLKKNGEPIAIIVMIANQIRLLYQVKVLYLKGNSPDNIAGILEVHPYRVKLAIEKCRNYSENTLLELLEKLADLDVSIKSGKIDADIGLELFLLGM